MRLPNVDVPEYCKVCGCILLEYDYEAVCLECFNTELSSEQQDKIEANEYYDEVSSVPMSEFINDKYYDEDVDA